jgi:hypothetical protein
MANVPFFMKNVIIKDKASIYARIMKTLIFLMTLKVFMFLKEPRSHFLTWINLRAKRQLSQRAWSVLIH